LTLPLTLFSPPCFSLPVKHVHDVTDFRETEADKIHGFAGIPRRLIAIIHNPNPRPRVTSFREAYFHALAP
jgi:hypothetical protein